MKILDKIENLSRKVKISIAIIFTLIIALLNFLIYNYQVLKIPENKRDYTVDLKSIPSSGLKETENNTYVTSENTLLEINLNGNYTKEVLIYYKSDSNFSANYTNEIANNYGLFKEEHEEDLCYSALGVCGINLNHKVESMKVQIGTNNVAISRIEVKSNIEFNWITFIFWTVGTNLLLLIFFERKFFLKKKHYLAFILCMGFGIILLTSVHNMTTTTLDDETHYRMANSLMQQKEMTTTDYYLENCLVRFHYLDTQIERNAFQKFMDDSSKSKINTVLTTENLLLTNKINYLPMGLTMKIADTLGASKTTCYFMARAIQCIIYSIVIACAVKIIPTHKMLLLIIGLLPQSLYLASNFNYDPTVTAFILLSFAAFIDEYHHENRKINLRNVLIFVLAGLYGVFPKAIYSPFLLLMLLLPKKKFKNQKQYNLFRALIIGLFIVAAASFIIPLLTDASTRSDLRGGDTSAVRQLKLILHAPVSFVKTFWYEAVLKTPANLFGPDTFGILSYYGRMTWDTSYILIIIAILLALFEKNNAKEMKVKDRIYMTILYVLIICAIWGSMYLVFTPVGEDVINGVQPRYFIPMIFPILYLLSTKKIKNEMKPETIMTVCTCFTILANLLLIYQVIIKVYCL